MHSLSFIISPCKTQQKQESFFSSCEVWLEPTATAHSYESPGWNIQGDCLLYQAFKVAVSSIKHSRWLSPLSNIQGGCLLYQAFKVAVSSIKHSRWLSPLSNIQGGCLLYQTFKVAISSIKHSRLLSPLLNTILCKPVNNLKHFQLSCATFDIP